ncbi:MAG: hypothetical protein BYD32DRAFT_418229 [Podila humilis]|nr:MAG: hypothetical protein BYD32DRAFT_418229 [Podila humilis]
MRWWMASLRLVWPLMLFSQVGAFESSKSAMKVAAPEFKALMTILRSTGPVISTRRSWRPGAGLAALQVASSRMLRVSGKKSGKRPLSSSIWRCWRRWRRAWRVGS